MNHHTLAAAVLLLLLAGCGGGTESLVPPASELPPKERIAALENAGTIPKLDRSAGLLGTDANGDGVRDDVGTYLAQQYTQPEQLAAAMQTAKGLQRALAADTTDTLAVKAVDREISRGINCVYARFPAGSAVAPARVVKVVESVTANTKERLQAYLLFSKALNGTSSALPEGNTCE